MFPQQHNARVAVLMSTYNGQEYIQQQIESILPQLSPADILFIRDDGSTDETANIIARFSDDRIRLICGSNIGFGRSFFHLIYNIDPEYNAFLLSDQDDIWLPGKIERAALSVRTQTKPTLYCSRLKLVDKNLKLLGFSPDFKRPPQLWNALCENIATGCTVALNLPALELIREVPLETIQTERIKYHDWWLYLCISAFGKIQFDTEALILYRQHGKNSIGMKAGIGRYFNILRIIRRTPWTPLMLDQIQAFNRLYGTRLHNSNPEDAKRISKLAHRSRLIAYMRAAICPYFVRQAAFGTFLLRGLLLIEFILHRR